MSGPGDGIEGIHDPPTGSFDTAAIAAAGDERPGPDRHGASRLVGHGVADAFSRRGGAATRWVTPMAGGAVDDGGYLRALLGNLYFLVPAAGAVLGLIAGISTSGQAVPPALPLTLVLIALGCFDALAGLAALVAFTIVTLVTGNLIGSHMGTAAPGVQTFAYTITGLFGLGVLWFAGGLVARRLRPIRPVRSGTPAELWFQRLVDYAAVPIVGTLVIWLVAWKLPTLTGNAPQELFVSIQNHLLAVKVVAFCGLLGRALLQSATVHNFDARVRAAVREEGRSRPAALRLLFWAVRGAIGFVVLWEFLGFIWMMWVCLALLLLISPASWLGRRLPRWTVSRFAYPLVLLRLVVVVVLAQLVLSQVTRHLVNPTPMLGAVLIAIGAVLLCFALLDHPVGMGRARDWKTSVTDTAGLALLVLLIYGILQIPATPFIGPRGVWVAPTGAVFVADTGNNRVVLVWKSGYRETVGMGLSRPSDVVGDGDTGVKSGYVYIVDGGNSRVLRIPGYYWYTVGSHTFNLAAGGFGQVALGTGWNHPQSACVDGSGNLFVADTGNDRIVEIPRAHQSTQSTFWHGLDHPLAVMCDPFYRQIVYVANTGAGTVLAKLPNGKVITVLSGLDKPSGLAEDPWGHLYVAEMGNGKVLEVTGDAFGPGSPLSLQNGTTSVVDTGLGHPRNLSVDALGNVFISDADGGQVKVLETIREHGLVTHGIPDPSAVGIGPGGAIYVTDVAQGWLQRYQHGVLRTITTKLVEPVGVAPESNGSVWVDTKGGALEIVSPNGQVRQVLSGLKDPRQLAPADGTSGVYVVERGAGEVLLVSPNGAVRVMFHGLDHPVAFGTDGFGHDVVALQDGKVLENITGPDRWTLLFNLKGVTAIGMDRYGNAYVASSRYRLIVEHVLATGRSAVVNRDFRSLSGMAAQPNGVLWVADHKSIGLWVVTPVRFSTQL